MTKGCADNPALHDPTVGPEAAALQSELRHELLNKILRLPPRDRDVIVLRYWGNLSHVEIAAATGNTVSAVKSGCIQRGSAWARGCVAAPQQRWSYGTTNDCSPFSPINNWR
jgi:DNA-directed RNA polymerase specialized sigma24 family protein